MNIPTTKLPLNALTPHPENYNTHPASQIKELAESLATFGQFKNIVTWTCPENMTTPEGHELHEGLTYILAGHGLWLAAMEAGVDELEVKDYSGISYGMAIGLLLIDNAATLGSEPDVQRLAALLVRAREPMADKPRLAEMLERLKAKAGINGHQPKEDAGPQLDKAAELQKVWGVQVGDVWELGQHRLVCGDCTDRATVEAAMRGERAALCHADPPYGMGKENEGIANDNLYREKLDAFQMQWWRVGRPYLEDNASAYIWGNADDLWRLWYCGGLRNSERLTFRNEIVWDKGNGQGIGSEDFRSYAPTTERALFFMLGEQGFNNNADNYWEGWEPIREYLKSERDKMGWDNAKCKILAGHSPTSGCHWFDASQWIFVTEDVYIAWQSAANGQAFKRDYDALKRDFYATRAYFDNAHENMTDVWQFPRVQGDDRWGHATPKPVEVIKRIVKSSSPDGAIVYSPFLGSGTDLIAAENLGRKVRAIELDPGYCAVALERWSQLTGQTPRRVPQGDTKRYERVA